MKIVMYPTEFEGVDEVGEVLFRVECFDEFCSKVEINTVVTPELWQEIATKVHEALLQIHKKEGK